MLRDKIKIEDCIKYKFPHGAVYLGPSDELASAGFLEVAADRATNKIMRPLPEHLKQISGALEIELFDEQNRISIRRLNPEETFIVPANNLHVYRNRGVEPSLTYWEYQGNAATLIDQIKAEGIKV